MAMPKTNYKLLLIDADSLLYEAACVNENTFDFGDGNVITQTDLQGAKDCLDYSINQILTKTKCKKYLMYITGDTNFRYQVLPSYKHNRKDIKKPALLKDLKEYVLNNYPCKQTTIIEADDACCIHITKDPKHSILAHIDKDLNQAEGLHYNWRKDEFYEVSYLQGQRYFYEQVLSGDATDGYKGCPMIGKVKAKAILDTYQGYELVNDKFVVKEFRDINEVIITQYQKAYSDNLKICPYEQAKEIALQQARVARMLRHNEFKDKAPILWDFKPFKGDLKSVRAIN